MALKAAEGARVAHLMGSGKSALFMGNRGVIVVAPSVVQAFDESYYFEKAAAVQVLALSTGRPLDKINTLPSKFLHTCASALVTPPTNSV